MTPEDTLETSRDRRLKLGLLKKELEAFQTVKLRMGELGRRRKKLNSLYKKGVLTVDYDESARGRNAFYKTDFNEAAE